MNKSIYKSKLFKSLLLYLGDNTNNSDYYEINKLISNQFPQKQDVFQISDEQFEKSSRLNNKINSNFCIPDGSNDSFYSNLKRVNRFPKNYTLRKEYVRCGKSKNNKYKSCPHGPYYYAYWREKLPNKINPD
ncbi:MAG: hypothetical protein L0H53_06330 [Candidatus Nitrosocosmicus sp.]|nr:hypothetical protein [Candidatus Nitrosocosmicus sp.]MDN5868816.1 hypothetical protein [Candidatus Nitrosocosmicus sp.]